MAAKLDRKVAPDEKMLSTKPHYLNTSGRMTNKKRYISIFTRPVATKLDKIVTYDKDPQT